MSLQPSANGHSPMKSHQQQDLSPGAELARLNSAIRLFNSNSQRKELTITPTCPNSNNNITTSTTSPQTWITSTANALGSNGVMLKRISSGDEVSKGLDNLKLINKQNTVSEATLLVKCAQCGTRGEPSKFYANCKEFCSIQCLKAATKKAYEVPPSNLAHVKKRDNRLESDKIGIDIKRTLSSHKFASSLSIEMSQPPVLTKVEPLKLKVPSISKSEPKVSPGIPPTYDWTQALWDDSNFTAAPVSSFKHAPVRGIWENVQPGMKLEVENSNAAHPGTAFWVASVIKIQGYKVRLRFEGFGEDSSRDFWANLCLPDVHPVGWCATKNRPLIPPSVLTSKYADWRDFLVKRLTGARTIPQNFHEKVANSLKSRYEVDTQLEVVDKNRICRVRLARVVGTIGRRLHLVYHDNGDMLEDFWCHENSTLIHPCGWARAVGQEIYAPEDYNPPDLRSKMQSKYDHIGFQEGMKLEAVDPLNPSEICAATIKKILKFDYIMVRIDSYEEDSNGFDWFCYHLTSSSLFSCGFCATNGIPIKPPNGYRKDTFNWESYLKETKCKAAPLDSIKKKPVSHNFNVGMRLEAADLMDPKLICVATIARITDNIMKIHFDGWEEEYDQWLDASSPDIYPIGWCELVKHKLEAPPQPQVIKKTIKKKGKKLGKRGSTSTPNNEAKPKRSKLSPTSTAGSQKGKHDKSLYVQDYLSQRKSSTQSSEETTEYPSSTTSDFPSESCDPSDSDEKPDTTESTEKSLNVIEENKTPTKGLIPKLVGSPDMSDVTPNTWTVEDVSQFLALNDCGAHCDSFVRDNVNGEMLLGLTKDQIIVLTGMKVGPAVKILDLVSQLKRSVNAARVKKNLVTSTSST